MSSARTQRRLAAILAADVVGYSRLMGQDEAGTLAALKALRTEVMDPKIAEHVGRDIQVNRRWTACGVSQRGKRGRLRR